MKLTDLIWVLALAGSVAACNTGVPVEGCTIDPATGACEGAGGPGTGGTTGTGGTGGSSGVSCDFTGFSNAMTCDDGVRTPPIDCDYGCTALGNTFGFAAVLGVDPDAAFAGGGDYDVNFNGCFVVSEAFIAGAEAALMADLNSADVNPGAAIPVAALSGVTGPDTVLTLPVITLDLDFDADGNTVAGPFPLPFEPSTGTYSFEASGGTACFNLTDGINFTLTVTEINSGPTFIPANFLCEPANQMDVNADPAVITPEPTAGQVCFDIP